MKPASLRRLARLLLCSRRWRVPTLVAPLLCAGCADPLAWVTPSSRAPAIITPASAATVEVGTPASHSPPPEISTPAAAPPTSSPQRTTRLAAPEETPPAKQRDLPIDLDTVLRLAEGQNNQILLARSRLQESHVNKDLVDKAWLPALNLGMAYYRHEGGIQNQDGSVIHSSTGALWPGVTLDTKFDLRERTFQQINAERKVWQHQGDVAQLTTETLQEAATAYIDLLSARTAEVILQRLAAHETALLKWAEALYKQDKSAEIMVESIKVQTTARLQALAHIRQQGDAAAAKLAYLLGLGPDVKLIPVDARLVPVELIDAHVSPEELVNRALATGPGIREIEGLLATVEGGLQKSTGLSQYLPIVEMRMIEGAFGAGPGASTTWDNRWDMGLQMRWNLSEFLLAKEKRRLAQANLAQVHLTYQDLRGKLTLGVQESQQLILSAQDQMSHTLEQIRHADKTYQLSNLRLTQRIEGSSTNEVMQAIRGLEAAHLSALNIIRAHNKAQVRLLLLTGAACARPAAVSNSETPAQLPAPSAPAPAPGPGR